MCRLLLVAMATLALAAPAYSQAGRVHGVVKSTDGKPIKGATVTAQNPNASPTEFTATSDERGRWAMIGLRPGSWKFTAEAPTFQAQSGTANVRTIGAPNPPLEFTLAPTAPPGPAGVTRDVQAELQAAEDLRNKGQFDEAISAYKAIKLKNPSLTMLNMVIGSMYRQKAAQESDAAAKRAALEQARSSFEEMLKADPSNERAKVDLALTHMQATDVEAATLVLEPVAGSSSNPDVFYNLGEIRFSKGDIDGAESAFKRASELAPSWQQPRLKLGLIAFNRGDRESAIKLFEAIVAAEPDGAAASEAKKFLKELGR